MTTSPAVRPASGLSLRRRPRDRKQQILAAAASQFWTRGYHQVGMADIAAAVDLAPSALYRHHRSKQELLVRVLHDTLDALEPLPGHTTDLAATLTTVAATVVTHREFGALWERERAHLPPADRDDLGRRVAAVRASAAAALDAAGPAEQAVVRDLRVRAVVAVLGSPSNHRIDLKKSQFAELLSSAAVAVAHAELGSGPPDASRTPRNLNPQQPVSRRQALLVAAIRLFAAHGYPEVSLVDIGAATGISGPSIYSHFAGKHELLTAGLHRGSESLWLALQHAQEGAAGPMDALVRTLRSYAGFTAANPDIVTVMLSAGVSLPEEERERHRRTQNDYLAEWVVMLRNARPELDATHARLLVHAAAAIPNTVARVPHLAWRPQTVDEITTLGRAVLGAPPPTS